MWIDLEKKESKLILHDVTGNERESIGKQRIVIPTFDLYCKEDSGGTGSNLIIAFSYEIKLRLLIWLCLKTYYVKYHLNLLTILNLFLID